MFSTLPGEGWAEGIVIFWVTLLSPSQTKLRGGNGGSYACFMDITKQKDSAWFDLFRMLSAKLPL